MVHCSILSRWQVQAGWLSPGCRQIHFIASASTFLTLTIVHSFRNWHMAHVHTYYCRYYPEIETLRSLEYLNLNIYEFLDELTIMKNRKKHLKCFNESAYLSSYYFHSVKSPVDEQTFLRSKEDDLQQQPHQKNSLLLISLKNVTALALMSWLIRQQKQKFMEQLNVSMRQHQLDKIIDGESIFPAIVSPEMYD